jgi:DNA-binding transcriptional MerR regulator
MAPKARVQKRLYYKIGEACKELGIQPYVLRYWETEFPALSPSKSRSGQRVYSEKELEIIRRIKVLLYDEGYTIAGAKKKLEGEQLGSRSEEAEMDDTAVVAEEPSPRPTPPALAAPAASPAAVVVRRERPIAAPPGPEPVALAVPEPQLDSDASQTIQTLRTGIRKALQESREILALLDSKSPE